MPPKLYSKGQSGNPGGLPNIARILAELGEKPGKLRKEIFEVVLLRFRRGPQGNNDPNWRYTCDWLSGHLRIKPKDHIVHEFGDGDRVEQLDWESLSDAELDAIIAAAEQNETPAPDGSDGNTAVH